MRRVRDHGIVGDIARLAIAAEVRAQMWECELRAFQAPALFGDVVGLDHREQIIKCGPLDARADGLSYCRFAKPLFQKLLRNGIVRRLRIFPYSANRGRKS
jgi:hypothetical protein